MSTELAPNALAESRKRAQELLVQADAFTCAYIEAALWSSNDESDDQGGEPLDANCGPVDLSLETVQWMIADCDRFQREQAAWLKEEYLGSSSEIAEQAGHDFWLTRNGHGCGFWDGDWTEPAATHLTEASKAFGECTLYVGDDGLIYHFDA